MRVVIIFLLCYFPLHAWADGFIPNLGQWNGTFQYKADIPSGAVFIESQAIVFHLIDGERMHDLHDRKVSSYDTLRHHAFRLHFVGSNPDALIEEKGPTHHYYNYYLGDDPSRWKRNVHGFHTVIYQNLYPGIDLHVQHQGATLKYEFHVEAGADPSLIQIRAEGLDDVLLDRDGNLLLRTQLQDVVESAPYAFQMVRGKEVDRGGRFVVNGPNITYAFDKVDPTLPLIIDPTIIFSTFSGSFADNWGFTATPDNHGYLYAGGIALGVGYPTTTGAFDGSFNQGGFDVAITKYDTNGTQLIYSTYLGGDNVEHPHSMIVNSAGNLYVMGSTGSDNFPTTTGAFDRTFNGGVTVNVINEMPDGSDIFVTAFNPSGTALLGSTYLGGTDNDGLNLATNLAYNYSDEFRGEINLDDDGDVYISSCTYSDDFPVTTNAFDQVYNGGQDAVVVKLTPALTDLIWSGYLGGGADEAAYGIDVASDSTIYVGGGTNSLNFPTHSGALHTTYRGGDADGFIAQIASDGSSILRGTYYGSASYDQIYFMQLDREDNPHFFGQTEHSGSNLVFNANWSDQGGGQILGVLEEDLGSRLWTTQFGSTPGRPNISPTAFLVDVCNSVYISGWGGALNSNFNNNVSDVGGLQTTNDAFQALPDSDESDFYLAVVAADGNSLVFGSFYGGSITDDHVDGGTSRFDKGGQIYHSVCASCNGFDDFPIVPDPGAWSTTNNSTNCNNAVFKIDFELPIIVADFSIPQFACAPVELNLQNNSVTQSNSSFVWNLNGQISTQVNPSITFTQKGTYEIQLVINDPTSCNLTDTLTRTITIAQDTNYQLPDLERCIGQPAVLGPNPNEYDDIGNATISWLPSNLLDDPTALNPTATVANSTLFRLVIDYGGCQERILQRINIDRYPLAISDDTIVCSTFDPFQIRGEAVSDTATYEWSDDPSFFNILSTDSVLTISNLSEPLNYYYFRSTKDNGCQMLDTVLITVSDYDLELTPDTLVCKNDLARIRAVSQNPLNTFNYYWSIDGYTSNANNVIAPLDQPFLEVSLDSHQTFYLRAIGIAADGCTAEDTARVTVASLDRSAVNAYAAKDTFYRGEVVPLFGEPSTGGVQFYWTPTDFLSDPQSATPTAQPKEEMTYIWVVSDTASEQCTFRDTVTISPYEILCDTPEVYVPTGFTPNNDGRNDELFVYGRNLKEVEFSVFDRWGNEVFYTEDQGTGWNGTYKGEKVEPGVYVYHLRAVCLTEEETFMKGNVTLH